MKKTLKTGCKIFSFILAFCIVFLALQEFLTPKCIDDSTTMYDGLCRLESNSVDVLFLGSSQMFSMVDAQKLTEKYGISSYDFGASQQLFMITPYYLSKALEKQNPKLVMVEIGNLFVEKEDIKEGSISVSYAPMPLDSEKVNSLNEVFGGDKKKVIKYCVPFIAYHSRWKGIWTSDITYYFKKDYSSRGFRATDHIEEVSMAYNQAYDGDIREIPKESVNAILDIAKICEENNIELVFFKAPVSDWTRNDSAVVKRFLNENNLNYLEMNDYLDEIGIDGSVDFYDAKHLNVTGAEKATDFIAEYLFTSFNNI